MVNCAQCDNVVGNSAIGCDRCTSWFCPRPMCMGLPQSVIDAVVSHGGNGIAFVCTACRGKGNNGGTPGQVSEAAFSQLHVTVKALCKMVEALTAQIGQTPNPVPTPQQDPVLYSQMASGSGPYNGPQLQIAVREEVREIEERRIRANNIILRGTGASNAQELLVVFKKVTTALLGRSDVALEDIYCINSDGVNSLFRAKIMDNAIRRDLLNKSKELKNNQEMKHIYVNSDLTYKQRQALKARKESYARGVRSQDARHGDSQDRGGGEIVGQDVPNGNTLGQSGRGRGAGSGQTRGGRGAGSSQTRGGTDAGHDRTLRSSSNNNPDNVNNNLN